MSQFLRSEDEWTSALGALVDIAGTSVPHFWSALVIIGIGWNFAFVSATTIVTECHRPQERNKVQAFNDFLVFGSVANGSFTLTHANNAQTDRTLGFAAIG